MSIRKVAWEIERLVNTSPSSLQEVGEEIGKKGHFTLQQNFMRVVAGFIKQEAENFERGFYDPRNQATAELCHKFFEIVKKSTYYSDGKLYLPFV